MGEGFEWDVTSTADFIEVTHVTASSLWPFLPPLAPETHYMEPTMRLISGAKGNKNNS